jgi:hypothetical protein
VAIAPVDDIFANFTAPRRMSIHGRQHPTENTIFISKSKQLVLDIDRTAGNGNPPSVTRNQLLNIVGILHYSLNMYWFTRKWFYRHSSIDYVS